MLFEGVDLGSPARGLLGWAGISRWFSWFVGPWDFTVTVRLGLGCCEVGGRRNMVLAHRASIAAADHLSDMGVVT